VFAGNGKLFTVPYLSLQQSGLAYTDEKIEINGIDLNWWFQSENMYNFYHDKIVRFEPGFLEGLSKLDTYAKQSLSDLVILEAKKFTRELPYSRSDEENKILLSQITQQSFNDDNSGKMTDHLTRLTDLIQKKMDTRKLMQQQEELMTTEMKQEINESMIMPEIDEEELESQVVEDESVHTEIELIENTNIETQEVLKRIFDEKGKEKEVQIYEDIDYFDEEIPDDFISDDSQTASPTPSFIERFEKRMGNQLQQVLNTTMFNETQEELLPEDEFLPMLDQSENSEEEDRIGEMITLQKFKTIEPMHKDLPSFHNIQAPLSVKKFLSKGDPIIHLIKKSYVDNYNIHNVGIKERLILLLKLSSIVHLDSHLNFIEKNMR